MYEPIYLYPLAPEFHDPEFGARVIDSIELLYRIRKAMIEAVPKNAGSVFLLRLEDNLHGIVATGHGPRQNLSNRFRYHYDGDAVYLDRSLAYPPLACIATIMERKYFLERYECALNDITTHIVFALSILHGHENDLSNSLPVQGK